MSKIPAVTHKTPVDTVISFLRCVSKTHSNDNNEQADAAINWTIDIIINDRWKCIWMQAAMNFIMQATSSNASNNAHPSKDFCWSSRRISCSVIVTSFRNRSSILFTPPPQCIIFFIKVIVTRIIRNISRPCCSKFKNFKNLQNFKIWMFHFSNVPI